MQETATRFSGSWVTWAHGEPGSDEFRKCLAATCGPAGADRGATDIVRRQAVVNLDETGWREGRGQAWLWTAVTEGVSVFAIRKSRGRDGVEAMLGPDSRAVVGSDR